jgi:hypothetical protein
MNGLPRRPRRVACAGLLACFAWSPLAAQPAVRVNLGSDVTKVADTARLSMTLDDAGEQVGAIVDELVVPSALSFVEGELTPDAVASATIATEVVDAAADGATRRLRVTVKANSGTVLPGGLVAVLTFKAPDDIDEESVDVQIDHRASITIGDRAAADATGDFGLVTVLKAPPPVIACFFYMH